MLLRGVNVGRANRVATADLRALLEQLGCTDVTTVRNSGNAVFACTSAEQLAQLVGDELGVGAVVVSQESLREIVERLPDEVAATAYPLVGVLLGAPTGVPGDVAPDLAVMGDGCVYLGYAVDVRTSRMTTSRLERALGTGVTARTPATLLTLL